MKDLTSTRVAEGSFRIVFGGVMTEKERAENHKLIIEFMIKTAVI